jgi:hypothetical protein
MTGIIGLRTVAVRFTTAPDGAHDRTGAHVSEVVDGVEQFHATALPIGRDSVSGIASGSIAYF